MTIYYRYIGKNTTFAANEGAGILTIVEPLVAGYEDRAAVFVNLMGERLILAWDMVEPWDEEEASEAFQQYLEALLP